jgi:hypothetical protein
MVMGMWVMKPWSWLLLKRRSRFPCSLTLTRCNHSRM